MYISISEIPLCAVLFPISEICTVLFPMYIPGYIFNFSAQIKWKDNLISKPRSAKKRESLSMHKR